LVTQGSGLGTLVVFDVTLRQDGDTVSGGNSAIRLSGKLQGVRVLVNFVQPALGYSGTFDWTLSPAGAEGSFVSSVPNSGSSQVRPLP
jgi:hypothetical protein